jgi:hypothetical protein
MMSANITICTLISLIGVSARRIKVPAADGASRQNLQPKTPVKVALSVLVCEIGFRRFHWPSTWLRHFGQWSHWRCTIEDENLFGLTYLSNYSVGSPKHLFGMAG